MDRCLGGSVSSLGANMPPNPFSHCASQIIQITSFSDFIYIWIPKMGFKWTLERSLKTSSCSVFACYKGSVTKLKCFLLSKRSTVIQNKNFVRGMIIFIEFTRRRRRWRITTTLIIITRIIIKTTTKLQIKWFHWIVIEPRFVQKRLNEAAKS